MTPLGVVREKLRRSLRGDGKPIAFVFYDHTTDATPADLRPGPHLQDILDAIAEQVELDYAPEHGAPKVIFRIASSPDDRQEGEEGVHYRDNIPEAPNALAYHTVVNGIPDIEIGCDLFETVTTGTRAISGGVSHEILERLLDGGANGWKDKGDGVTTGAEEVCDPVQNTGYTASNGVALSNFVRRSYFIPGSEGPWDFLGMMTSQNDVSGGYEVQAKAITETTQVGGERQEVAHTLPHPRMLGEQRYSDGTTVFAVGSLTAAQQRAKSSPYSRAYRRGLRVRAA